MDEVGDTVPFFFPSYRVRSDTCEFASAHGPLQPLPIRRRNSRRMPRQNRNQPNDHRDGASSELKSLFSPAPFCFEGTCNRSSRVLPLGKTKRNGTRKCPCMQDRVAETRRQTTRQVAAVLRRARKKAFATHADGGARFERKRKRPVYEAGRSSHSGGDSLRDAW